MPRGIYQRSVRKAVPSVLIVKPSRPGETERKVAVLKIPLTKGKFAVIDECMEHLANYNWYIHVTRKDSDNFYAKRVFHYGKGKWKEMFLHHAIIGYPLNKLQVDHINGDTLDNRKENLRVVTVRENSSNKKSHRDGKLPGIYKVKNRWEARAWIRGEWQYIGSFKSLYQAAVSREKFLSTVER